MLTSYLNLFRVSTSLDTPFPTRDRDNGALLGPGLVKLCREGKGYVFLSNVGLHNLKGHSYFSHTFALYFLVNSP